MYYKVRYKTELILLQCILYTIALSKVLPSLFAQIIVNSTARVMTHKTFNY